MANFGNDFGSCSVEGATLDDVLRFTGAAITLALDNLAREDDIFEIKDGEVVIFKFVRSMGGYGIAERSDNWRRWAMDTWVLRKCSRAAGGGLFPAA